MESYINWTFVVLFFISLFIWLPKKHLKDWVIIFFFTAFLFGFIDSFVVAYNIIQYPVRFLYKVFRINVIFDFLVFPTICVFYNQTTYRSKLLNIFIQAFLYSVPITLLEYWFEKNTQLIVYKNWTLMYSFVGCILTFLLIRAIIAIIRYYSD